MQFSLQTGERSRLMLDIDNYRQNRRSVISQIAQEAVTEVQEHGDEVALDPMNPFERKVVHDIVAKAGLVSDSEGVGPTRHVVIKPVEAESEVSAVALAVRLKWMEGHARRRAPLVR